MRETRVTEEANEKYIVKLNETWRKGTESGSWFRSYEVDPHRLTAHTEGGEMPPYDE